MTHHYTHIGKKEQDVGSDFWSSLYRSGQTGWDHGEASPGLVDFLGERILPPGRVLVPGCGHGHDARALASSGFQVVAVDVVDPAIRKARSLAEEAAYKLQFERADFFDLPKHLRGPYDYLFEHTFFCAIDPALRNAYVKTAAMLIKPGGRLIGVFYNIQPESGPPFGTTRAELVERFSGLFDLKQEGIPRSFPNRMGKELFMLWQKKDGADQRAGFSRMAK